MSTAFSILRHTEQEIDTVSLRAGVGRDVNGVGIAALHLAISDLEDQGLVRTRMGDERPACRGGRPRRYVWRTRAGTAALEEMG